MEIIPAIDIIEGKCVRLSEGDYQKRTAYNSTPLEMAKIYADHGIKRLHVVDLDGAKAGTVINWKTIEEIASNTDLVIDFGGGVKSRDDVFRIKSLGIAYVTIGSMAVKAPNVFEEWLIEFGPDNFMLGADAKDGKIMISGWLESSSIDLMTFIEGYMKKGVRNVFCTDISKDGKLEGPALDLYKVLKENFSELHIIASGGVSSIDDIYKLNEIHCDGVIIGKAIYENRITLDQLRKFMIEMN